MRALKFLRYIGIAEGISFLVLLLIAMPLKYLMDRELAVKYIGWVHGVLFMLYIFQVLYVKGIQGWPFKKFLLAFIAAWLPLGTFFFDRVLKKEEINENDID